MVDAPAKEPERGTSRQEAGTALPITRPLLTFGEGFVFAQRYRIVRLIATGGMGAVYEAVHLETMRRRALKVMLPQLVSSPTLLKRFKREARIGARIESAFVVDVFDAGVDESTGLPFIAMELLQGEDLGRRLARRGRLSATEVVACLHQVALALDRSHAGGIVHRDLKPQNVFLVERDDGEVQVKLLDFGVAKLIDDGVSLATDAGLLGTPTYMAPEQFDVRVNAVPATDIHALGLMAFALLVGCSYWPRGCTLLGLADVVCRGSRADATARARAEGVELPAAFGGWFARAAAVAPEARFARAGEAVVALARALGVPVPAPPRLGAVGGRQGGSGRAPSPAADELTLDEGTTPRPAPSRTRETPRRRLLVTAGALAAGVLAIVAGAILFVHPRPELSQQPMVRPLPQPVPVPAPAEPGAPAPAPSPRAAGTPAPGTAPATTALPAAPQRRELRRSTSRAKRAAIPAREDEPRVPLPLYSRD